MSPAVGSAEYYTDTRDLSGNDVTAGVQEEYSEPVKKRSMTGAEFFAEFKTKSHDYFEPQKYVVPKQKVGSPTLFGMEMESGQENDEKIRENVVSGLAQIQTHPGQPTEVVEEDTKRILRTHFMKNIVSGLAQIQTHAQRPTAAVFASGLFRTMRAMNDQMPWDPAVEVVMALHDALIANNTWAEVSNAQYDAALKIVRRIANEQKLDARKSEKAIMQLESLGFDTTPFGLADGGDEPIGQQ